MLHTRSVRVISLKDWKTGELDYKAPNLSRNVCTSVPRTNRERKPFCLIISDNPLSKHLSLFPLFLSLSRQGAAGGEGGWKGRKRARELSELKDRLDRASDKEQQSWDLLKQAVEKGGGAAADEGRFKATGTNRAAEEMRVGAVVVAVVA